MDNNLSENKEKIKTLENNVNNITQINLNLIYIYVTENLKIIKEKEEQNQIYKDLEAKYNQTIENEQK